MEKLDENLGDSLPINESVDADTTFEPTIDQLMDELIDDEQTLREEEEIAALENNNPLDEIQTLKEESEMPLEQLLAKYSALPPMPPTVGPPKKMLKKSAKKQIKSQIISKSVGLTKSDAGSISNNPEKEQKEVEANVVAEEEEAVANVGHENAQANGKGLNENLIEDLTADEDTIINEASNYNEQKTSEKLKIRRSHLFELYPEQNFDNKIAAAQHQGVQIETLYSEDEDVEEEEEEEIGLDYVKKTIMVGSAFQAVIPGLSQYGDILPYENEDKLVWEPSQVSELEVEDYLIKVREIKAALSDEERTVSTGDDKIACTITNTSSAVATVSENSAVGLTADKKNPDEHTVTKLQTSTDIKNSEADTSSVVKDNEQALHLLVQCGYDFKEALRRKKLNSVPLAGDTMSIWSEEECQKFEEGIQKFGKDFLKIRQNQVRTRTMRELVQFYYLWKKSERRDHNFANADTVDHMDIYLNEGEDFGNSSVGGGSAPTLTATSTLITGRKINGCNQNNFSIMTGSAASGGGGGGGVSQLSSPTKIQCGQSRKRTTSDGSNSNILNSSGGANSSSQTK